MGTRQAATGLIAVVFLDGLYEDVAYYRDWARRADLVVAADGGAAFLLGAGLTPQVVVGDFDSLSPAAAERAQVAGSELVRHPVRKDATDGELAVDEALGRGATEIVLAGALGALDHTLGHLAILWRLAARGIAARLVAPQLSVRVLVAPAETRLRASTGTRVSVVPLGGDAVVTLRGLAYPLTRGTLPAQACLGLGNAVVAGDDEGAPAGAAHIAVHEGAVAVLVESGAETFTDGGRAAAARPARKLPLSVVTSAKAAVPRGPRARR